MPIIAAKARARIEAQGFCDLDEETYAQINYPLRLSPAICMVWTAVGTVLGYRVRDRSDVALRNGHRLPCVWMVKDL